MRKEIVEYGPGDITYFYNEKGNGSQYKVSKPESPIIEIWLTELDRLGEVVDKIDENNKKVALTIGGLCVTSMINSQAIHSSDLAIGLLGLISASLITFVGQKAYRRYALKKSDKIDTAIFHYQDLKKYEEIYPEEKRVTNNEKLKGISKDKILKRAIEARSSYGL